VGANTAQLGIGVNLSGTATEFVGDRWNSAIAGVYVWRLYDAALLALVVVHGFNGLRYVLTDYTQNNPLLRRAMAYTCVIGALVLFGVGTGMLWRSIDDTSIEMAKASLCRLYEEHGPNLEGPAYCETETALAGQ
jgi:hypothetical protein